MFPRDLVSRPDKMDETVLHNKGMTYFHQQKKERIFYKLLVTSVKKEYI